MASEDFKKFADDFIKEFSASAAAGKDSARAELEEIPFSIFVIEVRKFRNALRHTFAGTFANVEKKTISTAIKGVLTQIKTNLEKQETTIFKAVKATTKGGKAWKDMPEEFRNGAIRKRDSLSKPNELIAVIAPKYSSIVMWKRVSKMGYVIKAIDTHIRPLVKEEELAKYEEELGTVGGQAAEGKKISSLKDYAGYQLGHGELGGIGGGSLRVVKQEQFLERMSDRTKNFSENEKAAVSNLFANYNTDIGFDIARDQYTDSDGKLRIDYIPIITLQNTASNQKDSAREYKAIENFTNALKELVFLKGSATIPEMVRDTTLHNLVNKNPEAVIVGVGKPRKRIQTHSKGRSSGKIKTKDGMKMPRGNLAASGIAIGNLLKKHMSKRRKAGPSNVPMHLLGVFNKNLPDVVRANMGAPALENVTGRFAESVRVTDVATTPHGFPSFGYTYQRDPYQTFEPGGEMGTFERDPRRLIDQSMREIAAQFAMGRFYTRRV